MKHNTLSLLLAAALAASLAGCAFSTPASVGRIGDIEIPAGIYLLTQYNDYSTAASAAALEDGQTTGDVAAVLAAEATGTIGDEEVTATGREYLARLTLRDLEYYAAVETAFAAMGGTLSEDDLATIASSADSLWTSNGDVYAANGIGKESLTSYLTTARKATALLELKYGDDGQTPAADAEYESYIEDSCLYVDSIEFPIFDYSTYTLADADQKADIQAIAEDCAAALNDEAIPLTAADLVTALATPIAAEYLPQAMEVMGVEFDTGDAGYYVSSYLLRDTDLATYDTDDGGNTLRDAVDAADGDWTVVDLTTSIVVARKADAFKGGTLAELKEQYGLLSALKGEELQNELYAQGAALPHSLDEGAMNTYKAANIKRSV